MTGCHGQLLQRVRRGLASDQERTAFEAHLGSCADCRLALDVADDFEQVEVASPDDGERIARMAAAARGGFEQRSAPPTASKRRRLTWTIGVAAVGLTGAAAASGFGWAPWNSDPQAASLAAPSAAPARTEPSVPMVRPESPAEPHRAEAEPAPEVLPEPRVSEAPARSALGAEPPSARESYRLANEHRRAGRTAQAIANYRSLQRQHPGSAEARLSHVSLGRVLLQHGSAGQALRQFEGYLVGGSGQRLAAEALYGRGRALQALGRRAEEGENWRRLIREYPDSAYATHASRRLAELR